MKNQLSLALSTISLILSIIAIGYVHSQLHQANEHKKWENYQLMTRRYYEWFSNIPAGMEADDCVPFGTQNDAIKKWARAYFDLYSEEYWLYKNGLIPAEMWTVRIDSGVNANLISYPLLVRGYEYWKAQGLFVHPEDFQKLVDDKLLKLKDKLRLKDCKKNSNSCAPNPKNYLSQGYGSDCKKVTGPMTWLTDAAAESLRREAGG